MSASADCKLYKDNPVPRGLGKQWPLSANRLHKRHKSVVHEEEGIPKEKQTTSNPKGPGSHASVKELAEPLIQHWLAGAANQPNIYIVRLTASTSSVPTIVAEREPERESQSERARERGSVRKKW